MPIPGISLFGFWPEARGVDYLAKVCSFPRGSEKEFPGIWKRARERLAGRAKDPGEPDIRDWPMDCEDYVARVEASPLFMRFREDFGDCSVRLVEIDPLVAAQPHVSLERVNKFPSGESVPPVDLLPKCLPLVPEPVEVGWEQDRTGHGLLIRHSEFSLNPLGPAGAMTPEGALVVGAAVGLPATFVQVIRIGGRCYLRNGYHRAFALRQMGVIHMPCIFIEGTDFRQLAIEGGFDRELLEREDPPTCWHYGPGRATEVLLRRVTNVIAVSWTQFLVLEPEG